MKASKTKRIQEQVYTEDDSAETRAAGMAALDRIIEQMKQPMLQYREAMERARIIAEEAKARYEADYAPPIKDASESVKSARGKGRRKM